MNWRAYRRDPLALALLAILVAGSIATLRLLLDLGRPYGGFLEEYAPSVGDVVRVDTNTPLSWPNASSDLLNRALIEIDGEPYAGDQAAAYAVAASRGAPTVTLVLDNGGQRHVKQVPVRTFSFADYLDIKLPLIVTNVTLWVLAWIVFSSQPEDVLNRAASWVFGVLALALWTPFVSLFWDRDPLVWTLNAISNLAWALLGAAILAFAWRYPRPLRRIPAWAPNVVHAVGALFGLSWAACRLWIYFVGWSPLVAALDGLAFTLSLPVMLSIAVVTFAARLIWSWIVKNEDINTTNPITINNYIGPAPFTQNFSPELSPGNLGQWIGRQIVRKYADDHPKLKPEDIMKTEPRIILEAAKYKPK